jgi:hypothetical protein
VVFSSTTAAGASAPGPAAIIMGAAALRGGRWGAVRSVRVPRVHGRAWDACAAAYLVLLSHALPSSSKQRLSWPSPATGGIGMCNRGPGGAMMVTCGCHRPHPIAAKTTPTPPPAADAWRSATQQYWQHACALGGCWAAAWARTAAEITISPHAPSILSIHAACPPLGCPVSCALRRGLAQRGRRMERLSLGAWLPTHAAPRSVSPQRTWRRLRRWSQSP